MAIRLLTVLAALALAVHLTRIPPTQAQPHVLLGADMIAPASPAWAEHVGRFRLMRGEIARFRIDPAFAGRPEQVDELIAAGAREVVLQSRGCDVSPATVRHDLIDRGFLAVVDRYPRVRFWLEVGNETDVCGLDPREARARFILTYDALQRYDRPNLSWAVSLPGKSVADTEVILSHQADGSVLGRYDALAVHVYGHRELFDDAAVYRYVLAHTLHPLLLTEVGINDPSLPKEEKARRILAGLSELPVQVRAAMVFAIADLDDPRWPQYYVDDAMARALGARWSGGGGDGCRTFPETGHSLCHGFRAFWEQHGGLPIFGYPITGEFTDPGTGLTVQYFERARFEWHPGVAPERYDVLLGRVGAELLAAEER